jgi:hypothetical protein
MSAESDKLTRCIRKLILSQVVRRELMGPSTYVRLADGFVTHSTQTGCAKSVYTQVGGAVIGTGAT